MSRYFGNRHGEVAPFNLLRQEIKRLNNKRKEFGQSILFVKVCNIYDFFPLGTSRIIRRRRKMVSPGPVDGLILEETDNNRWMVYYIDRGVILEKSVFESEAEACSFYQKHLLQK